MEQGGIANGESSPALFEREKSPDVAPTREHFAIPESSVKTCNMK
jgi:hypothetical protein